MKYKVLIVDDHTVVREGLKMILETNESFIVAAEAGNGEEAIRLIDKTSFDVILMDLNMPIMSGLDAIKALNEKDIKIPIIILTTYNEDDLMVQGLELGAKGYLLKDTGREDLFRTIESAARGETLLQPEIMQRLLKSQHKQKKSSDDKNRLTEKELLILQAAAKGFRNKDIAYDLGIAERTVKAHFTNIFNKLNVTNRVEAIRAAIDSQLIKL